MGKADVVEKKIKKKKGRPSLLDLQKRRIKEQQQQIQNQKSHNPNSTIPITGRRSTRRNPQLHDEGDDDEEEDRTERNRRRGTRIERDSEEEERSVMKRKTNNATVDGSESNVDKVVSGGAHSNTQQVAAGNDGKGTTPLPDEKLLVFILDQLEKKDTYGVFSEPVDPEELPDYHEVIKHPMDFSTVRKKLDGGEYADLEEFESDVFLICSNAMQYNDSDTVYFRQARSIQELAEKSFDNLRQNSDEEEEKEKEQEPKRRGRPPTKHLKKPVGRPPLDRAGSENASGATLATGKENTMLYDLRRSSPMEKARSRDLGGRSNVYLGNSEAYNSGWPSHQKLDRHDDFTDSHIRGGSYKLGKRLVASTENRRDTYMQFHPSTAVNNSVFSTFDVEKKMLLPVGLHAEYGYSRSLARFAAGLGPTAWDIASKKIEKSLPPEVKFGPGWVGHDDISLQRQSLLINSSSSGQAGASNPVSPPSTSAHSALKRQDKSTYQQEGDNNSLGYQLASTIAALEFQPAAAAAVISIPSLSGQASEVNRVSPDGQTHLPQSSNGSTTPSPSFQFQRQVLSPTLHMGYNHSVNLQPQLGQLLMQPQMNQLSAHQLRIPTGLSQNHSQMAKLVSRPGSSDITNLFPTNRSTNSTNTSSCFKMPDSTSKHLRFHPEPTSESAPPDLNLQFQSPPSPSSSLIDSNSKLPDLALQL